MKRLTCSVVCLCFSLFLVMAAQEFSLQPVQVSHGEGLGVLAVQADGDLVPKDQPCDELFEFSADELPDFKVAEPLRLRTPKVLTNGSVELVLQEAVFQPLPARLYTLEATTDFSHWTRLQTKSAFSNEVSFLDSGAVSHPHRFYRVLEWLCLNCD